MGLKEKARIMDGEGLNRTITRMAHEILEKNKGAVSLVVIGIRTRGAYLAERLGKKIEEIDGVKAPLGVLDITLYRDDLTTVDLQPIVRKTEIPFDINGKRLILVDDVLYTGRTIRAALDALTDFGRPRVIELAILIDRGHRELPIRADFVGKNIPTSPDEIIEVRMKETDNEDGIVLMEKK